VRRERINVTRDLSLLVLEIVLRALFGDDYPAVAPHFLILSDEAARDLRFAQAFRALAKPVREVIVRRREQRAAATDIVGMLMTARDRDSGEGMAEAQLINEIMTLAVAGHETTASVLNWSWYLLSQHPDVADRLAAELAAASGPEPPPYLRSVLDEVLRLYPPGWLLTRRAIGDDRIGDYILPGGTEFYISAYHIQRNPDHWPAPDRFDPDRFARSADRHPLAMLPFSAGPRNCVGEALARLEIETHLASVAREMRLVYCGAAPPMLDAGVNLRSKHDFVMLPEIRAEARP
jgi:cytochrome P450